MVDVTGTRTGCRVTAAHVEAVMRASRGLVGIVAASILGVEDVVTLPQLRVLMMVHTRGPLHLAAVADALGVMPSNASRICDRLVIAGLLDRRESPTDRRHVSLTLSTAGAAVVDTVVDHRRAAIRDVLQTMSADDRDRLLVAFDAFSAAVGEPSEGPAPLI